MQEQKSIKLENVIQAANQTGRFFCKFLSANDTGVNGSHQDGIYLAKQAWNIFFPDFTERPRGTNIDRTIKVHIDNHYTFESRIVYYGQGTRDEYRITQFWSNAPFDRHEAVGDLAVFIPQTLEDFKLFILNTEEEIDGFVEEFGLSLVNKMAVYEDHTRMDKDLNATFESLLQSNTHDLAAFPTTVDMAQRAQELYNRAYRIETIQPDTHLLKYIDTEYRLFKQIEKKLYQDYLNAPFGDLDPLIAFANTALNRRKSRAGKSLEHHLHYIFDKVGLQFSHPGKTEDNKTPDFLLPSNEAYADLTFPNERLSLLGVKTTCKDRWRQVLNEGSRVTHKHLLTLQQGISLNQMDEMQAANLTLVVPREYHNMYPEAYQHRLMTVEQFIIYAKEKNTNNL